MVDPSATGPGPAQALRRAVGVLGRLGRGVLTGDRYEHYLRYHASTGCEHPPMTEAEYWRDYHAWQDDNPQGRCC